jgi:hypothetical protein
MFGVPVNRAQQRVDIDERSPIATCQHIATLTQCTQVLAQHRLRWIELAAKYEIRAAIDDGPEIVELWT